MAYEPEENEFPYDFKVVVEGVVAFVKEADITDCRKKTSE